MKLNISRSRACGLLGILALASLLPTNALAQEIWFAPPDNQPRGNRFQNQDFPHLFENHPAWSVRTDVFVLSSILNQWDFGCV
jgi:hypothetical protein